MSEFNAKEYWRDRPYKKFVVDLTATRGTGRNKVKRHQRMICGGATSQDAIRAAQENTFLVGCGRLSGSCRLATPEDLGASRYVPPEQRARDADPVR